MRIHLSMVGCHPAGLQPSTKLGVGVRPNIDLGLNQISTIEKIEIRFRFL